jgi:hypothetical protein
MKFFITVVTVFFMLHTLAFAQAGDRQITLTGKVQKGAPAKISPKTLFQKGPLIRSHIYNPWDKEAALYEGVLLEEFVRAFGAPSTSAIHLKALDGYAVTIEKELWESERIMLVVKTNGHYLPIREKGPLRIVFLDYDPAQKKYESNLPLWLWMITTIEFR